MYELIKKEFFNKEFLTSKSFIKMVCFTMVLIFAVVMGSFFGYVSADTSSYEYPLNIVDYQSSSDFESSVYAMWFGGAQTENGALTYDYFVNDFDYSVTNFPYADDITYYMILGNSYTTYDYVYLFEDDTFCFVNTPYTYQDCITFYSKSSRYYVATVSTYGDGTTLESLTLEQIDSHTITDSKTVNGETYYYFSAGDGVHLPLLGNMEYFSFSISVNYNEYTNNMDDYLENGNDSTFNLNYMSDDVVLPGFDNMVTGGSSGVTENTETSANNLYLNNAKWTFSIPKWSNLTGYSGNATFSSSLNDFQTDNLEDFYLRFKFRIDTTVSYVDSGETGSSGGGHGTSVTGNTISTGYLQKTFSYKDSTTGNNYKDVQLQYFYNQGCSQSFMTLNGIFDRCMLQKLSLNNSSSSDTSFYNWYNDAVNSNTHTVTKAMLYCYATLYDSDGGSSGNCTYYYNLLTGESGVTDSSMSINSNPVVDEDGNIEFDPSDETNDGTSINNNNSNSGVNVNQTVNVNNDSGDSKSWLWTLISSLLTSGSDDETISQAGMSDTLVNLVGINPWISLMSTAFGFVPATVWTSLSVAFIVVLGIMVVAFVLRVLLDLL